MEANSTSKWCFIFLFLFYGVQLTQCSVTYDRKALIINGQKRILFSGSIHYPRSTPQMWEGLIQKAKDGGLDAIDTYVFWNLHEPSPGNYNFEGRNDLAGFIKMVHKAGLYVHLRIGPYICAEWNFGGFPVWLKYVSGISFRTDNEPFKIAMQGFTQKIVQMMKDEKLFESQGGPIILSQIENEYGPQSKSYGNAGQAYVRWAAEMAVELSTGVPWVMCKEDDAPDPVINTCNGFYCDYFAPNKPYKPAMWTEAWTGWFTEFGGPIQQRPVEDLAFAVARFIQKGGSFVNYYMYQGGTNFGRTAGGPFITTSYDYDAPIDEYGLIRQPKYGHLKELHRAIKLCERALVSADPTVTILGSYEQAHVFSSKSGECAAFLSNYHMQTAARVRFNNVYYDLPPWSISILPDCKNVVFNTAKVGVQTSKTQMLPTNTKLLSWETVSEDLSSAYEDTEITTVGLLEQLNVTRDTSDYLWYTTRGQEGKEDDDSSDDLEDDDVDSGQNSQQPNEVDGASDDPDMIEKVDNLPEFDFEEEADVARKILKNLISSSAKEISNSINGDSDLPKESKHDGRNVASNKESKHDGRNVASNKPSDGSADVSGITKPDNSGKIKLTNFKAGDGEDDLLRTIFISNLPFDIDNEEVKQRFSGFGEVQSFIPVLHQITKRPKGTAFLKFKTADAVDAAFSAANAGAGLGIFLKGRQLKVLKALDKKSAQSKELEKTKKEDHDHRNLYLAKEGLIVEGTPAAEGVSASDMSKRQALERKKTIKLKSPNFHVSRTRLIMYNMPKSLNEKELKKLCIDAVTSRATKQKPVIRQIKFLKDSKKGEVAKQNHSRGVAFVEFSEHQHALVALRVLNNNPETFGSEHRPVVEFALDNVQTLKLRKSRFEAQVQGSHNDAAEDVQQNRDLQTSDAQPNKISGKRKYRGDIDPLKASKTIKRDGMEHKTPGRVATEESRSSKKQKSDRTSGNGKNFTSVLKQDHLSQMVKNNQHGGNDKDKKSHPSKDQAMNVLKSPSLEGGPAQMRKRKLPDQKEQQNRPSLKKRNTRKNKDRDVVDKLDVLVEQYRAKFSQHNSDRTDGEKQGSRQIKRWFES